MKYFWSFLMFLICTVIQGNLINLIEIFNITPNLILCLVVMFSFLYNGEYHGIIWGTVFGLISDILYMPYTGVSALAYFIIALAVIFASDVFNRDNVVNNILVSVAATLAFNVITFTILKIMGSDIHIISMIKCLPMIFIYNAIVTVILYQIFIRKVVRFRNDRHFRF